MLIEQEQDAYLLHARPYREHQQILSLLTAEQGLVSAITYINSSSKSAKKALLQPFIPLRIVLKGNGSLKKLFRIEAAGKGYQLKDRHLYSGFYLNEITVKVVEESTTTEMLYHYYAKGLESLARSEAIEPILREYEWALLDELGLSLDFSIVHETDYQYFRFIPEQGFLGCSLHDFRLTYASEHLIAIAERDLSNVDVMRSYKLLMRQIFDHLLGPKKLNSRKLFAKQEFYQ